MFTCPLFREFCELNKPAKLKGVNIETVPSLIGITRVGIVCLDFAKMKGTKIALHAKSPTFRAAKLKGFTVGNIGDVHNPVWCTSIGVQAEESPKNLEWGLLMQIAPPTPGFVMFQISSTRLLALQHSKKFINPIILTEYSVFSKSTSSTSTKSPLQAENSHCSGEDTDKKYSSEWTKTHHFKWKFSIFMGSGLGPSTRWTLFPPLAPN